MDGLLIGLNLQACSGRSCDWSGVSEQGRNNLCATDEYTLASPIVIIYANANWGGDLERRFPEHSMALAPEYHAEALRVSVSIVQAENRKKGCFTPCRYRYK